jgi:ketosteroid isomerase-like protein
MAMTAPAAETFLDRLCQATTEHDLESLVGCFTDDYRNETPAHPSRSFAGSERVRANWEQIFAFVPDVRATVTAWAADGSTVWSEWEMRGTRRDGTPHHLRGVIVFGLRGTQACTARLYLEPVDDGATSVAEAVRDQVHAAGTP